MPLGGVTRKIAQGENQILEFQVYFNSTTNKKRVIFTGEAAPVGAEWSVLSLTGFTISHTTFFEEVEITLGASIKVGDTGKLTFTPAETAAAAEGTYYGTISLKDGTSDFDPATYTIEILDEVEVDLIPVNGATIREVVGFEGLSEAKIRFHVRRACTRVQGWINSNVRAWVRENGWPIRIINETEDLTANLIRKDINDEDEQAKENIKENEQVIRAMSFDTNKDDIVDTAGGVIQLTRKGSSQIFDDEHTRITRQFQTIFT